MPIYEQETNTREYLDKVRRSNKCAICGNELVLLWDMRLHKAYLQCKANPHHQGIEREASHYEREGLEALAISKRRKIMEEAHGEEKTKALSRYMGGSVVMTKSVATEIVETLWGDAPAIEKTKCVLLCQTYQLNPLMKHLYLVGYKRKVNGQLVVDRSGNQVYDWSIQMGIGATRLLAQRKHSYSYLDMTPRRATKAEIEKILGDTADPGSIYGFVWIKDTVTGAEAFGLRGIKKNENIKGVEKGNTHLNQACVRAERLALDRQYPGEMPQNIETVDEQYMEIKVPDVGQVNTRTGEIINGESRELPESEPESVPPTKEHWCEVHNCAFELKTGKFGTFYAHKKPEGGWCNEKKKKEEPPMVEPEPEPVQELVEDEKQPSQATWPHLATVGELFTRAKNYNLTRQAVFAINEIGDSSEISDLDEAWLRVAKDKGFNPPE